MITMLQRYFREMDIDVNWYRESHKFSTPLFNKNLDYIKNSVQNCTLCNLHLTRKQTVFGDGLSNTDIMIIGEAPGKDEDEQGKPFIGRAGKLLDLFLKSIKLNRELVFITNTIKCRPPENRDPVKNEIDACASFLDQQIEAIKPKVLILLGKIAANRFLGGDKSMAELRQQKFFIEKHNIPIIVFYHPAYILRSPLKKSEVWEDLKYLKNVLSEHVS